MNLPWEQLALWGPTLLLLAMVIIFLLKIRPSVERIKLREFDVREMEANSRGQQAAALVQLSGGLEKMSVVLKDIAVDQRRAIDTVEILQRVNADAQDQLIYSIRALSEKIQTQEDRNANLERTGTGKN
jgi:DNA-binding protein